VKTKITEEDFNDDDSAPQGPSPADKAFIDSGRDTLANIELQPYSPERDVVAHIWIRSLPRNADFEIDQAIRNPIEARKKAITFGTKHKLIDTASETFWDAWNIFMSAMEAIRNSRVESEKKTKPKKKR
jgi:hypothetical protein